MIHLSPEQVIVMHQLLLDDHGGEEGGGHRGPSYEGVNAAVHAVQNSYYDTAEELAAAYAVYIIQGHVFLDGNKRAAAASLLAFLRANDYETEATLASLKVVMLELQQRAEAGERTDKLIAWIAGQI